MAADAQPADTTVAPEATGGAPTPEATGGEATAAAAGPDTTPGATGGEATAAAAGPDTTPGATGGEAPAAAAPEITPGAGPLAGADAAGGTEAAGRAALLDVRDLRVRYLTPRGEVHAVDGVSLSVRPGEVVAVVGESGSGKSVLARSVMGLERDVPTARLTGEVRFGGRPVLELPPRERRGLWARHIGMVFQDPLTSLNPVLRVGDQIIEVLRVHRSLGRRAAAERATELLAEVRIPSPRTRLRQYPHELSGGMRQRVAIALAIACEPELLIADEPTTALDVTVQRQVLDLLAGLTAARSMATLLVTHDLGIAARYADRTLVMYGGRLVEEGPARGLFENATHPYTQGLVRSIPRLTARRDQPLEPIPGRPPDPRTRPSGCRFAPRCPVAIDRCHHDDPTLLPAEGTTVACHLAPGRPAPGSADEEAQADEADTSAGEVQG